jgi:hypothetical protein
MSYGVAGFLASLLPWAIVLLASRGVIDLPCRAETTAGVKVLCGVAVAVAVFASTSALRRRVDRGWAVAALVLGLAFAVTFALSEPATAGALAIPAAAIGFVIKQWR